jgi:type I restriction enzyme R subunit
VIRRFEFGQRTGKVAERFNLNERFGTSFTQADQLFFDQVKAQAKADTEVVQRAVANPYDGFALALRGKLLNLMIDRMGENQAIVTKYIDDKEFQDTTFAEMARRIYDEIRAGGQVSG